MNTPIDLKQDINTTICEYLCMQKYTYIYAQRQMHVDIDSSL